MKSMIVWTAVFLAALAVAQQPAAACSCADGGPFSKVGARNDLVVLGEVVEHHENTLQLKIVQVLKGREERQWITVWGDNGNQCRPYVSRFPAGTRWVLSLAPLDEKAAQQEMEWLKEPLSFKTAEPPFYVLSICGAHWLEVRGEKAYGRINAEESRPSSEESIPVDDLVRWFEQGAQGPLARHPG
jgi:hypothetical protein